MLKLVICDDDDYYAGDLETRVGQYCAQKGVKHSLRVFQDPAELLRDFRREPADVVLLDILMPGMTGVELSHKIRDIDSECVIAFLTSTPDFALEGYEVEAANYLLKPVPDDKLHALLDKCVKLASVEPVLGIPFKVGHGSVRLNPSSILYLESRNRQVLVYTDDETITLYAKLSELLPNLPESFVQIHKSHVVNLERIRSRSC